MTILCITVEHLPGIRPCTHLGQHRVTCHDHEGWRDRPGACRGCLPRKADRGYLCQQCFEKVTDAHFRWRDFARLVIETEGRAVSPEGGGKGSSPDGYTNLPLTFLTLDECERHLRSGLGLTIDTWVHTEAGARDAIQFAHAATRAYQSLEVEKRELKLERVRCPHCGLLSLTANPTREKHGQTIVECQHCGELLDKIRDTTTRWLGSEDCEGTGHVECLSQDCRCDCHSIGRVSSPQGIPALCDADQHTLGFVDRAEWETDGRLLWRAADERKTA